MNLKRERDEARRELAKLQDYIEKNEPLDQTTNAQLRAEVERLATRNTDLVRMVFKADKRASENLQDANDSRTNLKIAIGALKKIEIPSCELQQGKKSYEIAREAMAEIKKKEK